MEASITKQDSIITAYRDHGFQMTRMNDGERDMMDGARTVLAELLGRSDGCAKGKGGSMHMYDRKNNFYGGNGIVGAHIPVATGIAFEYKYNNLPNVCISPYGDGASNQGQFFEAINMAALWKIPQILVCENNHYGMGTSQTRSSATPGDNNGNYYMRGAAHGVPGIRVDGMDVLAVRDATAYAKQHCVEGNGPMIIEFDTYRYHGHSMSDPGISYREKSEVDGIRATRDPIELLKKRIIESGWSDAKELKALEKGIRKQVDEAAAFAKASPELPASDLFETVHGTDDGSEYFRGCDLALGKNVPDYLKTRR
jgi:pyruvate dehydrogenase E1 component alpha subunit